MSGLIEADILIAGAGSVGCVPAARLTEDPQRTAVLIGDVHNQDWAHPADVATA